MDDIDYIETHGTGTVIGDTIEADSICNVYGSTKKKVLIGSVKTNFGHLEAAAGMASLIKILLCFKHKAIPKSIHFNNPNKSINWDKVQVVTELTQWDKEEGKRKAALSCYGITGTLAHVILEEPDKPEENPVIPYSLLTLSAKSEKALKCEIEDMIQYLKSDKKYFSDIAYTSNLERSYYPYRCAIGASSNKEAESLLVESLDNSMMYQYNSSKTEEKKKKIGFGV